MQTVKRMIIPAAGHGTRMQALTHGGSKEIIPVKGRPALMYAIREAVDAGIAWIGLVIRDGKADILDALAADPDWPAMRRQIKLEIFHQPLPTGEAGAVLTAADRLGQDPFVVYYPDNMIARKPGTLRQLIRCQRSIDTDLVLLTAMLTHAQAPPCGLEPLGRNIYRLLPQDTPATFPFGLRPTGIYIATAPFLDACRCLLRYNPSNEIKDRDVRRHLAEKGRFTHGVDLSTDVLDIGNPAGYRLCSDKPFR